MSTTWSDIAHDQYLMDKQGVSERQNAQSEIRLACTVDHTV
jgi:hypothetical protein